MENKHEAWELKQMQALPLCSKLQMSRQRIKSWVDEFGEDGAYVSFSGGKDSTVLLDIVRHDYPRIWGVFINTGLEFPSVRRFALAQENIIEVRPEMNFREVIIKYGYPIIGKEIAQVAEEARKGIKKENGSYQYRIEKITGTGHFAPQDGKKSQYDFSTYKYLLNAPFKISDRCCKIMKKNPAKSYEKETGKKPIMGIMASESRLRKQRWIRYGCNIFDDKNNISSNPLSFWTERDVLMYIYDNQLAIAEAYGKIIEKKAKISKDSAFPEYESRKFETTDAKRTGCIFCGFGIASDKKRFSKLLESEPVLGDYVMRGGEFSEDGMWQPSKNGLGFWFVLEWLNSHGNLKIEIPNREWYLSVYQTGKTADYIYNGV